MDDRDFMDMMYQGFTKTTHAEDAYWGFEALSEWDQYVESELGHDGTLYHVFYVAASDPDTKVHIGIFNNEADAAFLTAVHGSFPDIHRRWLEALDEADRLDLEKDMAEGVAAELSDRLAAAEKQVEDWHGKATQA